MAVPEGSIRQPSAGRFLPFVIPVVVLGCGVAISMWASWYTDHVSLPRYCADPAGTLERVERILTETRPAEGGASRRNYLVAAKLLFILPRQPEEAVPDYLARVGAHLEAECR